MSDVMVVSGVTIMGGTVAIHTIYYNMQKKKKKKKKNARRNFIIY